MQPKTLSACARYLSQQAYVDPAHGTNPCFPPYLLLQVLHHCLEVSVPASLYSPRYCLFCLSILVSHGVATGAPLARFRSRKRHGGSCRCCFLLPSHISAMCATMGGLDLLYLAIRNAQYLAFPRATGGPEVAGLSTSS